MFARHIIWFIKNHSNQKNSTTTTSPKGCPLRRIAFNSKFSFLYDLSSFNIHSKYISLKKKRNYLYNIFFFQREKLIFKVFLLVNLEIYLTLMSDTKKWLGKIKLIMKDNSHILPNGTHAIFFNQTIHSSEIRSLRFLT